jgi:hypothetical protein
MAFVPPRSRILGLAPWHDAKGICVIQLHGAAGKSVLYGNETATHLGRSAASRPGNRSANRYDLILQFKMRKSRGRFANRRHQERVSDAIIDRTRAR